MTHNINRNIRSPEQLGIAYLGNPHTAIVPPIRRIERADYGRKLAYAEGGIFTPSGYLVPTKNKGGKNHAE